MGVVTRFLLTWLVLSVPFCLLVGRWMWVQSARDNEWGEQ